MGCTSLPREYFLFWASWAGIRALVYINPPPPVSTICAASPSLSSHPPLFATFLLNTPSAVRSQPSISPSLRWSSVCQTSSTMHPFHAMLFWALALFAVVTGAPHPQYDTEDSFTVDCSTSSYSAPKVYTTPPPYENSYPTAVSPYYDTYMTSSYSYNAYTTSSASFYDVYDTTSSSCYDTGNMSSSYYYPPDTCTACTPYYPATYVTSSPYSPSPDTSCYTSDIYYTSDTTYSTSMAHYPPTTSCDGMSSFTSHYHPDASNSSYYCPDTKSTTSSYHYPLDIGSSTYYPEMSCNSIASSYYYPPYTSSLSCYPDTSCTPSYYYPADTASYYPDMSYMTSVSYYSPPGRASSYSYYRETSSSYSPPMNSSPSHYGCLSKPNSYLIKAESSSLSGYTEEYSYLIWTPAESDTGFTSYSFCSIGYSIHAPDSHAAILYSDSGCLDQGTASLAEYWKAYAHHLPPAIEAERLFVLLSGTSYPYPVGLDSNMPSGAGYTAFGVDFNGYLTYDGQQSWALCTPSSGSYTTDTLYLYWLGGNSCPDSCYPATLKLVPYGFPYPVDRYYKNHGGNCGAPSYSMTTYTTSEHGYTTSIYTSPRYPIYTTSYGGDSYPTITYNTPTYTSTPYGGGMYPYPTTYGGDTYSYCASCSYSASHGGDYAYPTPMYPTYTPPYGVYSMGSSCGEESYYATPAYPTYPIYSPPYGYTDSYTDSHTGTSGYTLSWYYSPPMQYETDLYEASDYYYTASYFSTTPAATIYTASVTEHMTTVISSSTYTETVGGQVATAYTTILSYDE